MQGDHEFEGNDVLIQILDPVLEMSFPKPFHPFDEIYQFKFADVTYDAIHTPEWDYRITTEQAKEIIDIILSALKKKRKISQFIVWPDSAAQEPSSK